MTRIRDAGFSQGWKRTSLISKYGKTVRLIHGLFGAFAIALIVIQSAESLNITLFAIWLILGGIALVFDLFRSGRFSLQSEMGFILLIILGVVVSIPLANLDSMFFLATLGRVDIILFQVGSGLCLSIRFFAALYYIEFHQETLQVIQASNEYTTEQLKLYKQNLIKTDFEFQKTPSLKFVQIWNNLLKGFSWPFLIFLILSIIGVGYALLIYFIIPEDAIRQLIIRPSFIFIGLLYSILLIRLNSVLPKMQEMDDSKGYENEEEREPSVD